MPFNEGLKFLIIFGNVRNLCQSPRPPEISERSIFQTFWKPDFGARFLSIELDTSKVSSSINKNLALKSGFQKVWKILLLPYQSRLKKKYTNEEFTIAQKCRASEAFKTESIKNAYKTTWTKSLDSRVKIR